jgi:hypothetical protein
MIRNLKALGFALGALLALGATIAAAPAAAEFEFHSDGPTTLVAEEGSSVLTVDAGKLECEGVSYHAEMDETTEKEITEVEQSAESCTAFGFTGWINDWNGCFYRWVPLKRTGTKVDTTDYLVCPAGKTFTTTVFLFGTLKCTLHYPPQDVGTTTWNGKKWVREYNNLTYSQTAGTGMFACANAVNTTNGQFVDEGELEGEDSGGGETPFSFE